MGANDPGVHLGRPGVPPLLSVPALLAQLNSTVLALMDRAGVWNVARQMRYFDAHLEQALNLVLTGSRSVY
jgi:hypothetical protein